MVVLVVGVFFVQVKTPAEDEDGLWGSKTDTDLLSLSTYGRDTRKMWVKLGWIRNSKGVLPDIQVHKKRLVGPEGNVLVDNLDLVSLRGVNPDFSPVIVTGRSREADCLTYIQWLDHLVAEDRAVRTGECNIDFRDHIHTLAAPEGENYLRVDGLSVARDLDINSLGAWQSLGGARCRRGSD